jgi:hypothetical protein
LPGRSHPSGHGLDLSTRAQAKVFWVLSSEKNAFPVLFGFLSCRDAMPNGLQKYRS